MDTTSNAPYEEGLIYRARITDQMLSLSRDEEPQLILTVKILSQLKNDKNLSDGTEECPQLEREVRITIVEDDYERLAMALRDLERLGFTGDDVTRLHPDHPECFSLLDKEVFVRMKEVNGNEYWNLAWVREKPKPVAIEALTAKAPTLEANIAAARQRMKEDRARKQGKRTNVSSTTTTPPDVAY
jgi:hypothetical protein